MRRRDFIANTAAVGLVTATSRAQARAQAEERGPVAKPAAELRDFNAESGALPHERLLTQGRSGSDAMVDVLKKFELDYVFSTAGSSFRGLQESVVTYGDNKAPEFITCLHEEASIAMAHGYAKVACKPASAFVHATVGVQHASMAVYNAYVDRVPVYIVIGNTAPGDRRRAAEWPHSAQDNAALLRDFLKWDDQPATLQHFADSAARAYSIAVTAPAGPVALVVDSELQENSIGSEQEPKKHARIVPAPPQGEARAVEQAASILVAADMPLLVADRMARTPQGLASLVQLAELLGAPVIDQMSRMNFPTRHELNVTFDSSHALATADVIVGMEMGDIWSFTHTFIDQLERTSTPRFREDAKIITITARDLALKANMQEFGRFMEVDLAISGDAEATLPSLIEAVQRQLPRSRVDAIAERRKRVRARSAAAQLRSREEAAAGWNSSPISTARLCGEIWRQIRDDDWSFLSDTGGMGISYWPQRLWDMNRHYHALGNWGAGGIGYGSGAAVGAALANREHGRLQVAIIGDGDFNFCPSTLWTAAHHKIPLLLVIHNNRGYHQEVMHLERMALRRERGLDRAWIGTTFPDPLIDYAKIAEGYGVFAEGPVSDPEVLAPAIARALAVVRSGAPALLDVVTQPR